MLDCQLWGLRAGGHHLTNIVLHTIAVVLLFLALQQMTGGPSGTGTIWQSAFVAALFAIHPLHVESVAWISERKDVLSAVFFMLTLSAYVRYARSPSIGRYLTMSILFALGLMSKPMLATVPFVLLLLDYWPLGRWPSAESKEQNVGVSGQPTRPSLGAAGRSVVRGLVVEKLLLLALSVASGLATLWAQQSGIAAIEKLPLISRITNGLVACVIYLKQMIWPVGLAVFYPHPEDTLPIWEIGLAFMLVVLASVGAIALRCKHPYIFTGWFWYLIMLLPVIGLIQVGSQAHADRYTYLPQIGLYILLAWGISDVLLTFAKYPSTEAYHGSDAPLGRPDGAARRPYRTFRLGRGTLAVAACVAIIALAWRAYMQASYWHNGESLWRHALAVTSRNFMAHDGFGVSLLGQGRLDEAINQFQMALKVAPGFSAAETNLSIALTRKGRIDDAISQLRTLVKEHPDDAEAHYQLGSALLKKGDLQSATAAYEKALSLQIRYPAAHYNLGIALDRNGRIDEAIAHYQEAVREDPHYAEAYYVLGNDLLRKARIDDAIAAYKRALESRPTYPEPENNLGLALIQKGRPSEAVAHWQNALAIQPDFVNSLNNLAWVLATFSETWIRNGRQALALAERANRLSGKKNPAVLRTLAAACAENGRFTEARVTAEQALELANAQGNSALANIFEADIVHYRANAPVRTATHPENSPP